MTLPEPSTGTGHMATSNTSSSDTEQEEEVAAFVPENEDGRGILKDKEINEDFDPENGKGDIFDIENEERYDEL